MANRAHSTRTPLLPQAATLSPLLGSGFSKQLGPVTQAIRTIRAADPASFAIAAIEDGLGQFFADADRQCVAELRRRIADRIEADLALLDALDGDCDLEEDDPAGGDICNEPHDPEEDACSVDDAGHYLSSFDGRTYRPLYRRRFP